jgi:hypothetical protein
MQPLEGAQGRARADRWQICDARGLAGAYHHIVLQQTRWLVTGQGCAAPTKGPALKPGQYGEHIAAGQAAHWGTPQPVPPITQSRPARKVPRRTRWRNSQRKARRRCTGPVTIVVRTSALQGAVGPAIRTSASQEGSYTAQSDPAAGRVRQKRKRPGALGTRRAQVREENAQPGGPSRGIRRPSKLRAAASALVRDGPTRPRRIKKRVKIEDLTES